jgi:hypothetical protein
MDDYRVPSLMIMSILVLGVWLMRNRGVTLAAVNSIAPTQTSYSSTGVQGTANIMPVSQTASSPGILQQLTGLGSAAAGIAKFFGA